MQEYCTVQVAWRFWIYISIAISLLGMQLINLAHRLSRSNTVNPQTSITGIHIVSAICSSHQSNLHTHLKPHGLGHQPFPSNMADNNPPTFHFYAYTPSLAAAVIFIILFALTTALHAHQLFKIRAWYLIPIVIGGLCTHLSLPCLPTQTSPHSLIKGSQLNLSAILAAQSPASRVVIGRSGRILCKACSYY